MYNVTFIVEETAEKEKMTTWIQEELEDTLHVDERNINTTHKIAVVEIRNLFDWVKIHRLQKKHHDCIIFPLLDPSMLKTSPIAIELQLQTMLVKPVKKHTFIKSLRKVITSNKNESAVIANYGSMVQQLEQERTDARLLPFQEAFLRRLLRAEVKSEEELFAARSYLSDETVPNAVCFIQGFIHNQSREKAESAPLLIQSVFNQLFSQVNQQPSFLAYKKHLLMLIQVPHGLSSIRNWQEGESNLLQAIEVLKNKHGIHLYIGVGSIYREPLLLSHSYREARKARRTPHYNRLSLRYFEEITTNPQINTCTSYIALNFHKELTTKIVADQINISVPYFCKLFKKETGRSFVEYVTFVRLQRAVWMLRHTDQTIEQIADELGFNTPNYFSTTFKKYVSITPSEYRLTDEILFV
ncbi:helix-turn-helix domain-containing protein [Peribacillus frigoritolerans]|uniref:helix-turn-helix domain-containing protein n=1 Tax=Peribacillus frigoritolerans TaxID=450367 RepID=UPI001059DBA2|nr:AraC family transcriptional regulator [Peribacillus frigoritolerans]TDL80576.1 AraC family transcriptional regulator [Peribacillus frigoritolerans]